jgi:hypothetical protein
MKPFLVRTTEDWQDLPAGSGVWVERINKRTYRGTWSYNAASMLVTIPKNICERPRDARKRVPKHVPRIVEDIRDQKTGQRPLIRRCLCKHLNGTWSWNAIVFQNAPVSRAMTNRGFIELACCRIEPRNADSTHDTKAEAEKELNRVLKVLGLHKAAAPAP